MAATGTEQQYEGAILNQLIKNAERLAVLEQNVAQLQTDMAAVKPLVFEIRTTMYWVKWFLGAIGIGILANLFSQPILSVLHLH